MKIYNLGKGLNHRVQLDRLSSDSVIIDAGAGRGQFIEKMRSLINNCHIISIECNINNLKVVKQFNNIDIINGVLVGNGYDDEVEFTEFIGENGKFHQWGNIYSNGKNAVKNRKEFIKFKEYNVKTYTIDSIISKFNLNKIDYLKMDIEHAEYDVIMTFNPSILVEQISFESHNKDQIDDMTNKLKSLGYRVKIFDEEVYAYL